MTREDLASGILLLVLALGMWWMACADRGDGSAWAASGPSVQPVATAGLFESGRHAFRLGVPPGWAWTAAPPRSPGLVGWRALGSFHAPPETGPATVRVDWLRLDREVRVEDYLDFEASRLRRSITRIHPAEGRRPRTVVAETWGGEGPERAAGVLALAKLGERLYRLDATLAPGAADAERAALLEAVRSFQPIGTPASSCAEDLALWRPHFGGPLTIRYPVGWEIQEAFAWESCPALLLRSRGSEAPAVRMLLLALDAETVQEETLGACLERLLPALAERLPELPFAGWQVRSDTDSSTDRMPHAGRMRSYRTQVRGRDWDVRVRLLRGDASAVAVVVAGPSRETDEAAWMIHRAAFDLVADLAREE